MSTTHVELFSAAGFKPRKPLVAKSRDRLFAELECRIPADLKSFYESCNGVRSAKAECRALPLGEAIELIEAYDFIECFSVLPFFESENMVSDPCMYVLDGPLRGYIYHHLHDGTSRVLASSISKFARAFKNTGSSRLDLEKVEFEYPRSLSQKDKKIVEAVREDDDADSLLRELADGMSRAKKTGWAANYIDENPDFAKFLDRCEKLFTKAGIEVARDDHYGLVVGPNRKGFAWVAIQQREKRKDFDKYIVNFVRPRLG